MRALAADRRLEALRKGNEIRIRRARLKRDLKARTANPVVLLMEPPGWLETMRVQELLLAVPGVGFKKVGRLLMLERISSSKTVGGLTGRQRAALAEALEPHATARRAA